VDWIQMIKVDIFWVVTPCITVVEYQHFGGPCCLHLHGFRWPRIVSSGRLLWISSYHLSY